MPAPEALLQLPPHAPVRKAKMLDAPYVPILRQALSDVPRHILKAKYLRSAEQLLQTNLGRMHVAQHVVALVANELDPCLAAPPPHSIFAIVIRHLSATPARRPPGRVHGLVGSFFAAACCRAARFVVANGRLGLLGLLGGGDAGTAAAAPCCRRARVYGRHDGRVRVYG